MATTPSFVATPVVGMGLISAANTNRDGTGTIVNLLSAGANGTVIERIDVKAIGTTTAGMVRLYISDGTNHRLWKEIEVSAITPSGTVDAWYNSVIPDPPFAIPTGYSIRASTHNAESFQVFVFGGDY